METGAWLSNGRHLVALAGCASGDGMEENGCADEMPGCLAYTCLRQERLEYGEVNGVGQVNGSLGSYRCAGPGSEFAGLESEVGIYYDTCHPYEPS